MTKRWVLLVAAVLVVCGIKIALADYQIKDGNGNPQTVFAFVCQSIKICSAQVLIDSTGVEKATQTNPLIVQGYGFTPLSPMQSNISVVVSTGLTIPTGAIYAVACATGAGVNFSTDGTTTPSVSVGMPLAIGQCIPLQGTVVLANFRAIQQNATATLNVSYFK